MTRYDEPNATDGFGGPHILAGVPQRALDDALGALKAAALKTDRGWLLDANDDEELAAIAEAVLAAGLAAIRDA